MIEMFWAKSATRAAAIFCAVIILTPLDLPALAKSPQQLAVEAQTAQQSWQARASQVREQGMPRLSYAADAPLIHSVFDIDRLRRLEPIAGADVPHLLDACGSASNVMKSYLFWSKDGSPPDSAANEVLFAPELSLAGAYVITCSGQTAHAMRLFMASLPPDQMTDVRREGLVKAQTGMMQMVMGIGMMLNYPHYSSEQKLMVARALEDAVPRFAVMSSNESKAVMAASLASYLATANEASVKAILERTIAKVKGGG
jgi:hypothetical protein